MADIAIVFHGLPVPLDVLSIDDLIGWHERAIERAATLGLFRRER